MLLRLTMTFVWFPGDTQVDGSGDGTEDEHVDDESSKHVARGATDEQTDTSQHSQVSQFLDTFFSVNDDLPVHTLVVFDYVHMNCTHLASFFEGGILPGELSYGLQGYSDAFTFKMSDVAIFMYLLGIDGSQVKGAMLLHC